MLKISKKIQFLEPVLTVSTIQKLRDQFKKSLVLELYWEEKIDYEIIQNDENLQKISLTTLFRKFFSKKIRSIFN